MKINRGDYNNSRQLLLTVVTGWCKDALVVRINARATQALNYNSNKPT